MKTFLYTILFCALIIATTVMVVEQRNASRIPPPLQVFLFMFESGEVREFHGDKVEQRGNCTVVMVGEKPIVFICGLPHVILPKGPVVPKAPEPEPTPAATRPVSPREQVS